MELQSRIGVGVREIRTQLGLSQEALADTIGRSVDTVSLIERGKISPTLDTLDALSRGLGISLGALVSLGSEGSGDEVAMRLEARALAAIRKLPNPLLAVVVDLLAGLAELQ